MMTHHECGHLQDVRLALRIFVSAQNQQKIILCGGELQTGCLRPNSFRRHVLSPAAQISSTLTHLDVAWHDVRAVYHVFATSYTYISYEQQLYVSV